MLRTDLIFQSLMFVTKILDQYGHRYAIRDTIVFNFLYILRTRLHLSGMKATRSIGFRGADTKVDFCGPLQCLCKSLFKVFKIDVAPSVRPANVINGPIMVLKYKFS